MKRKRLIIFTSAVGLSVAAHAQPDYQPHATIYQAVNEYIAQHISSADYEVSLAPLDRQLKLPLCPETLEISTSNDLINTGRNSIGVRCHRDNKWSVFISAVIKTFQPVLVLTQPLQRGEIITRQHLALERKDVSGLRGDFTSQIEQIEHQQAIRALPVGAILSMRNVAAPKLIKRGDKIVISSARPEFAIRMNGLAMMDGVKGQLIRIKNQSSGRIINATVIEPGLVSVNR